MVDQRMKYIVELVCVEFDTGTSADVAWGIAVDRCSWMEGATTPAGQAWLMIMMMQPWNPWQMLVEPLGSAEPRLKITGLHVYSLLSSLHQCEYEYNIFKHQYF